MTSFLSLISSPLFKRGFFYKYRSSGQLARSAVASLKSSRNIEPLRNDEAIVIVGLGIAALTLAETLKAFGYSNIKFVGRGEEFGGKCVNFGCMPSEFFITRKSEPDRRQATLQFVAQLNALTQSRFESLGFPIIQGEVDSVRGKQLLLKDSRELHFDRLMLAMGNTFLPNKTLGSTTPLQKFWDILGKGGRVLILSDGQPTALSLADMALDLGCEAIVAFTRPTPLEHLPSFQHFQKTIQKRGVEIVRNVRMQERLENTLRIKADGEKHDIAFDHLFYIGQPRPNLPNVDGLKPKAFDIDFQTSRVANRADIHALGDASGLLSAGEAELQAVQLGTSLATGRAGIDAAELDLLPLRFHASTSMAMVGKPLTLLRRDWRSIDFKILGNSLIRGDDGKLWYLYDADADRIEAIHLCHADAGSLISTAAALMSISVSDSRWLTGCVHPSAHEIFKFLALEVRRQKLSSHLKQGAVSTEPRPLIAQSGPVLVLPPLAHVSTDEFFKKMFSEQEIRVAMLDTNPSLYLALSFGLKRLGNQQHQPKQSEALVSAALGNGRYRLEGRSDWSYEVDEELRAVHIKTQDNAVIVHY